MREDASSAICDSATFRLVCVDARVVRCVRASFVWAFWMESSFRREAIRSFATGDGKQGVSVVVDFSNLVSALPIVFSAFQSLFLLP